MSYIVERHPNIGDTISNRYIPNFADIMSNFGDKYWRYWKWCLKSIKILYYSMKNRTFTLNIAIWYPQNWIKYHYQWINIPNINIPKIAAEISQMGHLNQPLLSWSAGATQDVPGQRLMDAGRVTFVQNMRLLATRRDLRVSTAGGSLNGPV